MVLWKQERKGPSEGAAWACPTARAPHLSMAGVSLGRTSPMTWGRGQPSVCLLPQASIQLVLGDQNASPGLDLPFGLPCIFQDYGSLPLLWLNRELKGKTGPVCASHPSPSSPPSALSPALRKALVLGLEYRSEKGARPGKILTSAGESRLSWAVCSQQAGAPRKSGWSQGGRRSQAGTSEGLDSNPVGGGGVLKVQHLPSLAPGSHYEGRGWTVFPSVSPSLAWSGERYRGWLRRNNGLVN